jgi:hypothetical protein
MGRLVVCVIFLHLALIWILALDCRAPPAKMHKAHTLLVHMRENRVQQLKSATGVTRLPVASSPKAAPPAKKKPAKRESEGKPRREELRKLVQESLATLDAIAPAAEKIAKPSEQLELKSATLQFERNYQEELIVYLEQLLSLPEEGQIKLQLTLSREGVIRAHRILFATSEKNRNYLESMFPALHLPSFGSCFKGEKTHTFTIALRTKKN